MAENILVVEYEPRYTDRVRHALYGHPIEPSFARDGDEAIRALAAQNPKLIVLSSVIPKISTSELIHAIREHKSLEQTPILLTVSGYTGKNPKQDAQKLGASDILPKPYSETEFLGKVQQMLGVQTGSGSPGQLTSDQIFGDVLTEKHPASPVAKMPTKQSDDLDRMLADTLSGVLPQPRRKPAAPADPSSAAPSPRADEKGRSAKEFDKMLEDTLSGLERTVRSTGAKPHAAPPSMEEEKTATMPVQISDRIHAAEPLLTRPAPPAKVEEEPSDGIKFGQYVLLEKIATGGMAEVWKARMRGVEGFQKIVAIKKILPHLSDNEDFIEMFIDEAKLAAQLNHNNIIHIYDLGMIQNSYYIAMEYVDGWDLKTILKRAQDRDQPMSVELALFVASKIASALDYAHRKRDLHEKDMSLVHRDVSPQNVLISEEGDIKLCDFGIAKAASKASHTQAGALKGKLQYMSPEQAWGKSIDRRSDIFALSAVLFEMLTGRKLFAGDNEMSTLEQVREGRVVPPSQLNDELTPEIDNIVLKGLQKDAEDRYQTAGELARDLDQLLYSFRPTPTSADLAIYMHRLGTAESIVAAPAPEPESPVESPPVVAVPLTSLPVPAPPAVSGAPPMPSWEAPTVTFAVGASEPEEKKKLPIVPIGIAAGVVLAIAVGVWMVRGSGNAPAPAAANTSTIVEAPAAAPASATLPAETLAPAPLTATAGTLTTIDEQRVQQEVQKRLAAERARLEQQSRAAAQPTPPVGQPVTAAPPPVQVAATSTTPAVTETREAPPQPAPQPVAETQPPPTATAPSTETPRTRVGDLVAGDAPGLTAARMTRRANVPYPPMARAQRAEGSVLLNVLISETGQILDVRVLRPFPRPIGLTEAAVQTVRRSAFSPAMKDGVRVKMWIPVELNFRL